MPSKLTNIGIIGLGYVGLPLAIEFSKKYNVVGFDINQKRIQELNSDIDSTNEVGENDLKDFQGGGSLFTTNEDYLIDCDVFIVTVPTPIDENKKPDLRPLEDASALIGSNLSAGDIVIYESTVYPSCTEEVCIPILEHHSATLKYNEHFFVGYSPERINPADKVNTLTSITKVVSGSNKETTDYINELYQSIGITTHVAPNMMVAEMSKAIENAQRDLNISFVNEVAMYCNLLGIDTNDVLDAASTKWNFLPFKAGLVGGHCISVDPYYLIHKAESLGFHPNVIASGRKVNDSMPKFIASNLVKEMIRKRCDMVSRVLVMGITFKENTPDIRNSKVIELINELKGYKMTVDVVDGYADIDEVWDNHQISIFNNYHDLPNVKYDAIIYAVNHNHFNHVPIHKLIAENSVVYDLKGVLPKHDSDLRL